MIRSQPDKRRQQPGGKLSGSPLLAFYEITRACDCDSSSSKAVSADPGELSSQQSLRLIDQLNEFPQPPLLMLTGGDPLQRSDLCELVNHAWKADLNVSVTLNAMQRITPQAIARLRHAGISRIAFRIDGADAQTHDAIHGVAGTFHHTLRAIIDASVEGVNIQVNTTLRPRNIAQIDRMAELLGRYNIVTWLVAFYVPISRAHYGARLSGKQCEAAFARLWYQSSRQSYQIKTTDAPHYRRYTLQQQGQHSRRRLRPPRRGYVSRYLNDGKGLIFISDVGVIHPGAALPIHCGTFPQDNLVDVYQNSTVFRDLRDADRLEGKCGVCEFRHVCGGSRARAYAVTNNPFAEEPDCIHVPSTTAAQ